MGCPFLNEEQLVCKASIHRVVYGNTGKQIEYETLTESEAGKCRGVFRQCPVYKATGKIVCPGCGHAYLREEAVEVTVENQTVLACPECGSTQRRR